MNSGTRLGVGSVRATGAGLFALAVAACFGDSNNGSPQGITDTPDSGAMTDTGTTVDATDRGPSMDAGSDSNLDALGSDGSLDAVDATASTNPFVGTWSCAGTITNAEPDGGPNNLNSLLTITTSGRGELSETSPGTQCTTTASSTGSSATLTPAACPSGPSGPFAVVSGTETVSGDTLAFQEELSYATDAFTGTQEVTATCTRSLEAGADAEAVDAGCGDAALVCAQPPNPAPLIQPTESCGTIPAFAGGALVDGTYYATSAVEYPGDAGCSQTPPQSSGTIVICGGIMTAVIATPSTPGNGNGWFVGTIAPTSGTVLNGTCICGDVSGCPDSGRGGSPISYTATSTTITLLIGNGVGTFTRQ
jgi:hypothetical protein